MVGISSSTKSLPNSRSFICSFKTGTSLIITPASEALKVENRSSLAAPTETPRKRSERSVSSRFLPPGLMRYAASSVSNAMELIRFFQSSSLPPCTHFGIGESSSHFSAGSDDKYISSDVRATDHSCAPKPLSVKRAIGSVRPSSFFLSSLLLIIETSIDCIEEGSLFSFGASPTRP